MNTKILILGGTGMLGHKALQMFSSQHDTYVTIRKPLSYYEHYNLFSKERTIDNVDVSRQIVRKIIEKLEPDVVVNCIGVIKQSEAINNPVTAIEINALFPHKLAQVCTEAGIKLIHISTDCVFSGEKGNYSENDPSDVKDFYGKTKFLGEVYYGNALTLRTSIIGHELNSKYGLVEWFLSQQGKKIKGYNRVIFSGFTTKVLCGIILDIIERHKNLTGLYHVSSEPIDKLSLLGLIKNIYKLDIEIEPFEEFVCDRSLDSTRFRNKTNFMFPSWEEMIVDMYNDSSFYNELRR